MIVAGGGTGGHLFPGLAVAEAATTTRAAAILVIGSAYGIEATVVPKTRFAFEAIAIRGVRGRGWRGAVQLAWQLPAALVRAWRLVGRFHPSVVLGVGGYGSFPVVIAAWARRIPAVLLEQNARPGLTNRLLGHVATRVCTTFAQSDRFFPTGRAVRTGNPVRALQSTHKPLPDHFTIFVFGGSQGAHKLNHAVVDAAALVAPRIRGLRVIHQTGAADAEWVARRYSEMGVAAEVVPFIDDMASAYGRANVVVCRAGATTLAELASVGKPAILVPYPFAADDHQRANAEILVGVGAAQLILDRDLNADRLATALEQLAADRERLDAMGCAVRRLAVPDAARKVVEVCALVSSAGGGHGATL